jgi:muconate cycloisomerase
MRTFEHAAASRSVAEAVVVRLQWSGGQSGWGETLPRPYVTGETIASVVEDLQAIHWPQVQTLQPWEGLARTDSAGRCVGAAACAMELALWDVLHQRFSGTIPGRVSGVLGSADPARTARKLRLMRWYGLRDFKLKLGFGEEIDRANLEAAWRQLRRPIASGRCTLRVDVNGGWDAASTPARAEALRSRGVCVVEQPTYCTAAELLALARRCPLPLMADESLVTTADAECLREEPERIWWNIRLSKHGGIAGSLHLARMAEERKIPYTLGCMVGESSILSAAQRRLLQMGIRPRFIEGNYGRFLLRDDLAFTSLRFGFGGRLKPLPGTGLGMKISGEKLARYGTLVKTLQA